MPVYDQAAQDLNRDMRYAGERLLGQIIRRTASRQDGMKDAVSRFRSENGSASWTRVRSPEVARAVADRLREEGHPSGTLGRYVLHRPQDIWLLRAILKDLGAERDSYTARDGALPELPAAGETGLAWETHECSDARTAEALSQALNDRGFDSAVIGASLQYRSDDSERIIEALEDLGCREAAKDELDRDPGAPERSATERQIKYVGDLHEQGIIPGDAYATFKRDPTFSAARELLDRYSGTKASRDRTAQADAAKGPKDTDRDGISDTNEDLDSDGLDYTREEDQRIPVSDEDRDTRLDKLEAECTKAAEIDQPGASGRSEISINPESR